MEQSLFNRHTIMQKLEMQIVKMKKEKKMPFSETPIHYTNKYI